MRIHAIAGGLGPGSLQGLHGALLLHRTLSPRQTGALARDQVLTE